MFRVFSVIIIILILAVSAIFVTGIITDPYYENVSSSLFIDKVAVIWEVLTDIEKYPQYKKDVEKVEILEKKINSITKWREIVSDMEVREYEVLERERPSLFVVEMKNTKTGKEGVWTYSLHEESDKTRLDIKEESTTNNIFWRGLDVIWGRSRDISRQFKWLRVKLFDDLLVG